MKFKLAISGKLELGDPLLSKLLDAGLKFSRVKSMFREDEYAALEKGQIIEVEDVVTFCRSYGGRIVLDTSEYIPVLEIYNGWRE